MRALAVTVVTLLAAAALLLQPSAGAQTAPARVLDRTFACTTLVHAGIRKMTVSAWSTGQTDATGRKVPAGIALGTGGVPASTPTGYPSLDFVGGATLVSARTPPSGRWFVVSSKQCRPSGRRVALSPRGLDGGSASAFGEAFECFPPRAILLRTRAVFRTPTRLRPVNQRQYLQTTAPVREAAFAATTLAGNPLVYAAGFESGKARLFTSGGCVPD